MNIAEIIRARGAPAASTEADISAVVGSRNLSAALNSPVRLAATARFGAQRDFANANAKLNDKLPLDPIQKFKAVTDSVNLEKINAVKAGIELETILKVPKEDRSPEQNRRSLRLSETFNSIVFNSKSEYERIKSVVVQAMQSGQSSFVGERFR